MKRVLMCLMVLATACSLALAGPPPKSELVVSGSFVSPKDSDRVWTLDGQLAVPITNGGTVLLGPKIHTGSNDDDRAIGAVFEVNFNGSSKSGLFVGVEGLYDVKRVDGETRYAVDGLGGLKIEVGKGAAIKVYASKTVDGRGKDDANVIGNLGVLIRF